jgi:hypothetical protein
VNKWWGIRNHISGIFFFNNYAWQVMPVFLGVVQSPTSQSTTPGGATRKKDVEEESEHLYNFT